MSDPKHWHADYTKPYVGSADISMQEASKPSNKAADQFEALEDSYSSGSGFKNFTLGWCIRHGWKARLVFIHCVGPVFMRDSCLVPGSQHRQWLLPWGTSGGRAYAYT
jgi:hypothetical protein